MKVTTIDIRELEASEGMILTDGKQYAIKVYLAPSASIDDWWEIPIEDVPQGTPISEENEQENEEENE